MQIIWELMGGFYAFEELKELEIVVYRAEPDQSLSHRFT